MKHYDLSFTKEFGRWYIDYPEWKLSHADLEMVEGADKLCEEFSENGHARVHVVTSNDDFEFVDYQIKLVRKSFSIFGGADYSVYNSTLTKECWICPVTLFVLHEYPKYIYIRK